ncbi:sulfotransferase [Aquibium sp. A9E412]|uniref:sulfotransferase n=1 Tax=Aquibium sp. A9E412 TaxID=2976767 RepID=UPI0025B1297C|nr:sulfotransferase [Aquibium sp. A9E412]MDN2566097.1 sulfotransferase [Aquibium sp. A9E412]
MTGPYDRGFFQRQAEESLASARRVLSHLFADGPPDSVLDVGCGVGPWLAAARELGVADHVGVDGDWVDRSMLMIAPERFVPHDLAAPIELGRRFGLVISLEVAEHLPPEAAQTFVDSLTRHGDTVLFSAALPYQGGEGHRNEAWLETWQARFERAGFVGSDPLRAALWADPGIAWWYRQNIVVFRARGTAAAAPGARLRSLVHPEAHLRAVRRRPQAPFATTLEADLQHWRALAAGRPQPGPPPAYGREFDFAEAAPPPQPESYAELRALAGRLAAPVLSDALAPVVPRRPPPPPLGRGTRVPDFLGIGVQKAATTWMFRLLQGHPDVTLPGGKEVNFFNRRAFAPESAFSGAWATAHAETALRNHVERNRTLNPRWVRVLAHLLDHGLDQAWYETLMGFFPNVARRGDITPEYAHLPGDHIDALLAFAPQVRIVLLLREPVARVVSHVAMIGAQVPAARPFLDALAREPAVLARSRYETIVPAWTRRVPPERMLVMRSEAFESEPQAAAGRLAGFLGIDAGRFRAEHLKAKHFVASYQAALAPDTLAFLRETLAESRRVHAEAGG